MPSGLKILCVLPGVSLPLELRNSAISAPISARVSHSLQYVVKREQSIIQTKVVLLIALLAVARKMVILDFNAVDAAQLLALAAVTLALGAAYWLMRERDDRYVVDARQRIE